MLEQGGRGSNCPPPPVFGKSVNPIQTTGGGLCPQNYYRPPPDFCTVRRLCIYLPQSYDVHLCCQVIENSDLPQIRAVGTWEGICPPPPSLDYGRPDKPISIMGSHITTCFPLRIFRPSYGPAKVGDCCDVILRSSLIGQQVFWFRLLVFFQNINIRVQY